MLLFPSANPELTSKDIAFLTGAISVSYTHLFYQEYKDILIKVIDNEKLPIVYNVNFGHATPRCALQYGAVAKVDMKQKKIFVNK